MARLVRLLVAGLLAACSAYDPRLLTQRDASFEAGISDGSDLDASAAADGGSACISSDQEFCPEICPEICDGLDQDCDARIDEETGASLCVLSNATSTCVSATCVVLQCLNGASDCDTLPANGCEARLDSPAHCGFCYAACNFPNALGRCDQATCVFDQCLPGFGNCDGDDGNGCELRVDSLDNCGGCNVTCGAVANGQPGCIDSVCGVSECGTGFADCNRDASDGCETSLDAIGTCGTCDTVCAYDHAVALCSGGSCTPGDCLAGFGDCDGDPLNECEVTLGSNSDHCGACGRACDTGGGSGSAYQCVDGECVVITCPTGLADCDLDSNNGCETSLRTLTDCGRCDTACAYSGASASCSTETCTFTACTAGFGNCDTTLGNGCETPLDTDANCGACGSVCGATDARTCSGGVCSLASCAAGTADCDNDGTTCEQSLSTINHCGGCAARCGDGQDGQGRLPNATAACTGAVCAIGMCDANFANCDGDAINGCETSLRTTASCGACGSGCSRSNASVTCATGTCAITVCNTGFGDCDGNAANGCETNTNTSQHCAACNTACARQNAMTSCASGTCATLACNSGFGDCDGNVGNGCETQLNSLTHCGACNAACALSNGTESCATGTCTIGSCDGGFGNCDFIALNGCETPLNSGGNCSACGVLCDYQNGTETCGSGSCALTGCDGGFGNCDTNDSNGCEQALSTTAHCGGCNLACAIDERCDAGVCARGFPYITSNFDSGDSTIVPVGATMLACGVSTFNSATLAFGNWCGLPTPTPLVRAQNGGPDVVILAFDSLTIASGATLQLTGSRPVILAVYGDATVAGMLDASANGAAAGAGGNVWCVVGNGDPGDDGVLNSGTGGPGGGGGGGGAFGLASGAGGTTDDNQVSKGGVSSAPEGNPSLAPLRGGCPGGRGGQGTKASTATGGGGGGALQLSVAGTLSVTGVVAAAGGRGINGAEGNGGGGGGSGGAVLLEGVSVTIATSAWLTANGGGGAGGNPYLNTGGADGTDGGKTTTTQAAGGVGNTSSGAGGKGGAQAGAAQNGANATGPYGSRGGGGGGGSVGRIRIHSPNACTVSGNASPTVTTACP